MTKPPAKMSLTARCIALLIAIVIIFLGSCVLLDDYSPGRFTRFGYAAALKGAEARQFGFIMIMLGCLPLLMFCKTSRQAAMLGTALGVMLIATIFWAAYS